MGDKSGRDALVQGVISLAASAALLFVQYRLMQRLFRSDKRRDEDQGPDLLRKLRKHLGAERTKRLRLTEHEVSLLESVVFPEAIDTTFDDVGGMGGVKVDLYELVVLPFRRPDLYTAHSTLLGPPTGVLLYGRPGTGKTMLAKAICKESGATFISLSASRLFDMWLGETEKFVDALFSLAEKLAPTIIFIDEIDGLFRHRGGSADTEHEVSRRLKTCFFARWDGLASPSRTASPHMVTVLGTTNRPQDLDHAVVRRLARRFPVPTPDASQRYRILKVMLRDEALDPSCDLHTVAAIAEGMAGSDLKELCQQALRVSIRNSLRASVKAARAGGDAGAEGSAEGELTVADLRLLAEQGALPGRRSGGAAPRGRASEGEAGAAAAPARTLGLGDFLQALDATMPGQAYRGYAAFAGGRQGAGSAEEDGDAGSAEEDGDAGSAEEDGEAGGGGQRAVF